jgi:hypothetical protein
VTNQARIFEDDVFLTTGTRDGDDDCPSQSPSLFQLRLPAASRETSGFRVRGHNTPGETQSNPLFP